MRRKLSAMFAVLLGIALAIPAASAAPQILTARANDEAPPTVSTSASNRMEAIPGVQTLPDGVLHVAPEELGVTLPEVSSIEHAQLAPWRVEEAESGQRRMIFGSIDAVPLPEDTVKVTGGQGTEGSASRLSIEGTSDVGAVTPDAPQAPPDFFICEMFAYIPVLSGSTIEGEYDIDCTNVNRHRADHQIHRSSYRGWLGYDDVFSTAWTTDVTLSNKIFAFCNSGSGEYDYVSAVKSIVEKLDGGIATSPWWRSDAERYDCGPSEL